MLKHRHASLQYLYRGIALLFILFTVLSTFQTLSAQKKNIIWIIGDDVGDEFGFMGNEQVISPHLDEFAERGVLFKNAYCQSPLCNPSRTSFLSGLRPETHRVMDNMQAPYSFKADIRFYQHYFKEAGYYNIAIGKLAQNRFYDYSAQGFDNTSRLGPQKNLAELENTNPETIGQMRAIDDSHEDLIPENIMMDRAVNFLKNNSNNNEPFNLYVGFTTPHTGRFVPRRFFDLYERDSIVIPPEPTPEQREELSGLFGISDEGAWNEQDKERIRDELWGHYAGTSYLDHLTGAILEEVTRQNLWDNTIVVFTTDHGMASPNNWNPGKGHVRAEGTRVPLIIWDKHSMANGQTCPKAVELIDIVPTLLDLCNLPEPDLDGTSRKPLLDNPVDPNINPYARATHIRGNTVGKSIAKDSFQYINWGNFPQELYNIKQDPLEYENLANDPQYSDIMDDLKRNIIFSKEELHREVSHKPAVAFKNIEDGADFSFGEEITIVCIALDQDEDLSVVELFVDGEKVESQSQSPFEFTLEDLQPGNHEIALKAVDQQSHKDSAKINVYVKHLVKKFPDDYPYIDITEPPYNADNTGKTDATQAINDALAKNGSSLHCDQDHPQGCYGNRGPVIYFPEGTYLISDRIMPTYEQDRSISAAHIWIQGSGVDKTIIKLQDSATLYQDRNNPRSILRTGNDHRKAHLANAAFNNHVVDLTIMNGKNNPGAIGLWFDVANNGSMNNVKIVSEGDGFAGLTCDQVAGTGLVKYLEVIGFDYGVNYFIEDNVNNMVFEHLKVREQRMAGFHSLTKMTVVRNFESYQTRDIPAISLGKHHAMMILLGAEIDGSENFSSAIEISDGTPVYFRNLNINNYSTAIKQNNLFHPDISDIGYIAEYQATKDTFILNGEIKNTLQLPVRETPYYHANDTGLWVKATDFGAIPDDGKDDSDAIEEAINNVPEDGILYFDYGTYDISRSLAINTRARKIDFCGARLLANSQSNQFVIEEINNDKNEIIFNNVQTIMGYQQNSSATLVVKNDSKPTDITSNNESKGNIIVENLGSLFSMNINGGNKVWAHSVNPEVTPSTFNNCQAWLFGVNYEMKNNYVENRNDYLLRKGQIKAINNAEVEAFVIQDNVNHDLSWKKQVPLKRDDPVYYIENSDFSVIAGGAHRYFEGQNKETFRVEEDGNTIYRKNHSYLGKVLKYVNNGKVVDEMYHDSSDHSIYSENSDVHATNTDAVRSVVMYNNVTSSQGSSDESVKVDFKIVNGSGQEPVSRPTINTPKEIQYGNANGELTLEVIKQNQWIFSVNANTFFEYHDTVALNKDTSLLVELTPLQANVEFFIKDSANPVQTAAVNLNGLEFLSNESGKATFYHISARESYPYTVIKDGYQPVEDTFYLEKDTTIQVLLDKPVSLAQNHLKSMEIFPNPAGDILYIQSVPANSKMRIISANGKVLLKKKLDHGFNQVNLSDLKKGHFTVIIISKNNTQSFKIIK